LNDPEARARAEAARVAVQLYGFVVALMLIGILALVAYSIKLGPLVGSGVETSFGIAVALMFLMSAVVFHVVDRAYRLWPFGRHLRPAPPPVIGERSIATFVKILIFAAAAASIAYILGSLIAT
jgi:hypothetical protein